VRYVLENELCEVRTGERSFVRYVLEEGLCEVRTGEWAL